MPHVASTPAPRGPRIITGRMVLVAVVAFFVFIAAVNAVMIRFAFSSFGGVEVASSYKAGLAFESDVAAAAAQADRAWTVTVDLDDAAGRVRVTARDAEGIRIDGLSASLTLRHPADRRLDVAVPLDAMGAEGFQGVLPPEHGARLADLTLARGDTVLFRSSNRVLLP